ncbi:hypothetical protein [Photobacterium carnosum]|uniref:Rad50/SbcC-type AAA domain-containing protein n=1 Tax=Photobacterium carnosum TaxID=2023717 RepID=A0A2N4UQR6_9GAMM|nr:hypothetical protein [Photobacterium carnosum]PLC57365.1 hypothetical protein CIK00_13825 [Photobacterium carnosum]
MYEIFKNNHSLLIALESDLFESNIKVKELESHNNSLSKLISIGTEIVNKSESSDCPLCSKKYGNFQELKAAIESNKIIGLLSANLIKNNLEIKEKIENIKHENKKIELEYSSIVILQLDKQLNIKNSISTENFSLNIDKKAINNILSDFEKQLKDKIKLTGYKSEKDFNNDLLTRKDNLLRNDSGINYQINNVIKNIDATKKEISKINNIISISNKEQLYIINDTLYKDFKKESVPFLNNVFNDINYSQELLNKHLEKSKIIINELSNVINLENYRINELKSNIPLEYKNATSDYIDSLIKEIDVDCIEIDEYLKEYKKCFPDNISYWSDLEYCKKYITLKLGQLENSLAKTVVKLDELNVLTNLSSKAGLLSESISIQKENIELEIDIKNNIDLKYILTADIDIIDNEIKRFIDDYFHVNLINEIYNSIDPHPEFKEIKFDYVPAKYPELHIKVKGEETDRISPALNFSSAQVNVLSLSIFLAKALNTSSGNDNEARCIFIDDPIQSMDAINVLSIIDLLRNIAFRSDNQLVISTHDENFYELLKKKIPSNIFKSKYLKLESFGIVTVDE